MVTAEIIDIIEVQEPGPQGTIERSLRPSFVIPQFSGSFTVGPIPEEDFSQDRVRELITAKTAELVGDVDEVTVEFPS